MYNLTIEVLPDYIFGGKANFIIKELNSKDHIEFKIRQDVKDKNIYFVRYKSIDWKYIGILNKKDLRFFPVIEASELTKEKLDVTEVFYKLMIFILQLKRLPLNLEVLFTGECSICGRKLTDPKYIKIGIGSTCYNNIKRMLVFQT